MHFGSRRIGNPLRPISPLNTIRRLFPLLRTSIPHGRRPQNVARLVERRSNPVTQGEEFLIGPPFELLQTLFRVFGV
jgi:hypothetical protein